jgi:hypothetical protein
LLVACAAVVASAMIAASPSRAKKKRVLVELFTSQG